MIRYRIPRLRIGAGSAFLLAGLIVLILIVVLIPDDVDLPDAAFHRGTAPLAVHALATSVPLATVIATLAPVYSLTEALGRSHVPWEHELSLAPNFRPILLHTIRR